MWSSLSPPPHRNTKRLCTFHITTDKSEWFAFSDPRKVHYTLVDLTRCELFLVFSKGTRLDWSIRVKCFYIVPFYQPHPANCHFWKLSPSEVATTSHSGQPVTLLTNNFFAFLQGVFFTTNAPPKSAKVSISMQKCFSCLKSRQ